MIVVADSSPLNYLIQIQHDSLLRELYKRVFVPTAVIEELRHPRAPVAIASWLQHIPAWLEVRSVTSQVGSLENLDAGEREAILLAEEMHASLPLIDEKQGRLEAKRRSISTIGTLGVLLAGAKKGLADPELLFQRLITETTFRASPQIRERFLLYCKELAK
jgi:predicted nucleic acid-binding protein